MDAAIAEPVALPSVKPSIARPRPATHIPALDALRGIAVLMVTLYHLGGTHPGPASSGAVLLPALEVGARGVDLFFVLSGFLITGILYDTKTKERYFTNFYARRSLRIFPLYYLVLAVSFILLPWWTGELTWQQKAAPHSAWLWTYGTNILIAWRGKWCFGAFDHFWSLAVEEQFYLVWPLVIFLLSRRSSMRLCELLVLGAVVGRLAWVLTGGDEVSRYAFTAFRLDTLAIGAWLALFIRGDSHLDTLDRIARVVLVVGSMMLIPISVFEFRLLSLTDGLWTITFAALLITMVNSKRDTVLGRIGQSVVLQWLGKYSYGIYVFGNLLIAILAPFVTAQGLAEAIGNAYLGQLVYCAILMAATVGLAFCSWHLYEKYFLSLKAYFATKRVERPVQITEESSPAA